MSFVLDRRTLLRGAAAAVALPTMEAMLDVNGLAYAQGDPLPRRFVTWFFGNGVLIPRWVPTGTGTAWSLTPQLAPLTDATRGFDLKKYVSVVSGFDVKTPNLRGHHNGAAALLSGAPFIPLPAGNAPYASKFGAMSIDQVIADKIAGTTTFKSLQLAVSKRVTRGEGPTLANMSHRGPDQPMPTEANPANLFNTLFGNFTPKDPTDPRDKLRVSVLDAVSEDAKRLQTKLGAADKRRLDAHLTSISEVRTRILALPPKVTSSCSKPATVTERNVDAGGVEPIEAVSSAMSDLMALAFACDLTRVASFQFSGSVGGHCFKNLSPAEARDSEHSLTHDANQQEKVHQSVVFTMRNFAYLLAKLEKQAEGTGNLLDQTAILCTTDVTEGLSHAINNYPILVAGKAGGTLRGGVHFRQVGRNTSDVLFTLAQAVGSGVTAVGLDSGRSTTRIAEIMT